MKYAKELSEFAIVFEPEPLSDEYLSEFYYDGTMPIRMNDEHYSPINNIYKSCLSVRHQNTHLLLGHRGCGKSTELNMLKQRFEKSERRVSIIQCPLEADLIGITYWDLLILLGKHLCEIAKSAGCNLPESLLDAINDFWKEIETTETFNDEYGIAIRGEMSASTPKIVQLLKFFVGLSSELKFGYDKRNVIRDRVRKSTAQWIGYLKEVSDRVTQHLGGKQPIVIFEDLDKLSPEKAWEIFNNPLSQMPFPIIYTFPISLSYDPKFAGLKASFNNNNIHILPMIKIREINGGECLSGIRIIKGIVEKRADLTLFDDDALTFLINKTGGVLRDLFNCITMAAERAESRQAAKIELDDAKAAAIRLSSSLTRMIESKNYPMLKNIYKDAKYKEQIEDKAMLLDMMQGLIVLEYNGARWHNLHPLIEDFLEVQGELQ